MKTNYTNITEGEITIYCAHDVRACVEASLVMAEELSEQGKVLYLNTAFSNRKMLAAMRSKIPDSLERFRSRISNPANWQARCGLSSKY